jgi:hypothetical protein
MVSLLSCAIVEDESVLFLLQNNIAIKMAFMPYSGGHYDNGWHRGAVAKRQGAEAFQLPVTHSGNPKEDQ